MGFVRLVIISFVILTVIFLCVSLYSRSVRRERLERQWDANPPEGSSVADRKAYVTKGMNEYFNGFRRRLVLLIYVVPTVIIAAILYVMNDN
jgi:hypothetical protein